MHPQNEEVGNGEMCTLEVLIVCTQLLVFPLGSFSLLTHLQ